MTGQDSHPQASYPLRELDLLENTMKRSRSREMRREEPGRKIIESGWTGKMFVVMLTVVIDETQAGFRKTYNIRLNWGS
jgi:hypothetical protein